MEGRDNYPEAELLYAYYSDKVILFDIFDNPVKAALKLDNKKDNRYISRYINKERLVEVGVNSTPVYFVMHPSLLCFDPTDCYLAGDSILRQRQCFDPTDCFDPKDAGVV